MCTCCVLGGVASFGSCGWCGAISWLVCFWFWVCYLVCFVVFGVFLVFCCFWRFFLNWFCCIDILVFDILVVSGFIVVLGSGTLRLVFGNLFVVYFGEYFVFGG